MRRALDIPPALPLAALVVPPALPLTVPPALSLVVLPALSLAVPAALSLAVPAALPLAVPAALALAVPPALVLGPPTLVSVWVSACLREREREWVGLPVGHKVCVCYILFRTNSTASPARSRSQA